MKRFTLLTAMATLLLGMVAFYGSEAIAGQYDGCYTPAGGCSGTCAHGTCVPIATSLRPLSCLGGDPDGYRPAGSCGQCMRLRVIPSGEYCGQALSGEMCL